MRLKPFVLATLIAGSLAASAAFAQADPNIDPNQLQRTTAVAKQMDTNHDGMVSKQEFLKLMTARFDAMDKQGKGLTVDECAHNLLFLDVKN
jgi:tellurite resistance protein